MNGNYCRNWEIKKITVSKIFTWDLKDNLNQIIVCENILS